MESLRPLIIDIREIALKNDLFKTVVFINDHSKLTVMNLRPGQDIGIENHPFDQFIYIVEGSGVASLNEYNMIFADDFAISIPAGTTHNIINTGITDLKLYSLYSSSDIRTY